MEKKGKNKKRTESSNIRLPGHGSVLRPVPLARQRAHAWSALLCAAVLLLLCLSSVTAQAASGSEQEIRVGLTDLYGGRESLTVWNTSLALGYYVNREFVREVVLESKTGFVFTPVTGYYARLSETYDSYSSAEQEAAALRALGYEAYAVCVYQGTWLVYAGGSGSYATVETIAEQIGARTGRSGITVLGANNDRMKVSGTFGALLVDIDSHSAYPQFEATTPYKEDVCCVNLGTRVYRGRIEIGRYNKATLTAVNIVPLEEYLYSVVPSEMPPAWPVEALKAQAVCSRSYALVKAGLGGASDARKAYKLVDTTAAQVYKGYLAETARTTAAVDSTRGQTVCYENRVVAAYFFSTSGGRTEASADVWAAQLPYLQSVTDRYETDPERKPWVVSVTASEAAQLLKAQGLHLGNIENIVPIRYTGTGRVYALRVTGTEGSAVLQETAIRTALGLPSTKFRLIRAKDVPDQVTVIGAAGTRTMRLGESYLLSADGVVKAAQSEQYIVRGAEDLANYPVVTPQAADVFLFAGMGYGHGVGMSQSGAKGMAKAGFTYRQVIAYYFTGAEVR